MALLDVAGLICLLGRNELFHLSLLFLFYLLELLNDASYILLNTFFIMLIYMKIVAVNANFKLTDFVF